MFHLKKKKLFLCSTDFFSVAYSQRTLIRSDWKIPQSLLSNIPPSWVVFGIHSTGLKALVPHLSEFQVNVWGTQYVLGLGFIPAEHKREAATDDPKFSWQVFPPRGRI